MAAARVRVRVFVGIFVLDNAGQCWYVGNMPTATQIAGYTYKAETLCRDCTMQAVSQNTHVNLPCGITIETWLDIVAARLGINRYDEREYDSSDFPKVIFNSQLDPHVYDDGSVVNEICQHCCDEL